MKYKPGIKRKTAPTIKPASQLEAWNLFIILEHSVCSVIQHIWHTQKKLIKKKIFNVTCKLSFRSGDRYGCYLYIPCLRCLSMPLYLFRGTAVLGTNQPLCKGNVKSPPSSLMNHFQNRRLETNGHVIQEVITLSLRSLCYRNFYHLNYCPCTCVCTGEVSRECIDLSVCVLGHGGKKFPLRRVGCASVLY